MRILLGATEPLEPRDVRLSHQSVHGLDFPSNDSVGVEWAADLALRARVESAMRAAVLILGGDGPFRREGEDAS